MNEENNDSQLEQNAASLDKLYNQAGFFFKETESTEDHGLQFFEDNLLPLIYQDYLNGAKLPQSNSDKFDLTMLAVSQIAATFEKYQLLGKELHDELDRQLSQKKGYPEAYYVLDIISTAKKEVINSFFVSEPVVHYFKPARAKDELANQLIRFSLKAFTEDDFKKLFSDKPNSKNMFVELREREDGTLILLSGFKDIADFENQKNTTLQKALAGKAEKNKYD